MADSIDPACTGNSNPHVVGKTGRIDDSITLDSRVAATNTTIGIPLANAKEAEAVAWANDKDLGLHAAWADIPEEGISKTYHYGTKILLINTGSEMCERANSPS